MIVPIGDKILVSAIEEKEIDEVKSGILIKTDKTEKKIFLYQVISVGETVLNVNPGDKIYSYRYALQAISDGMAEKYIIKLSDVVALYKE